MKCPKCGGLKGRKVRATIVILDKKGVSQPEVEEQDLRDLCAVVDAWVETMLDGCEVRSSLPGDLVGHF